MAVIFKHRNSTELEIGLETGVWRWVNGLKGPDNRSEFSLSKSDKGIHFHRYVTLADEEFEPPARPYTFNWYLSWSKVEASGVHDESALIMPIWNSEGSLDFAAMNAKLSTVSSVRILGINLDDLPGLTSSMHMFRQSQDIGCHPCFAAGGTVKQLKRIIRQIAALDNKDIPVCFDGLVPGHCICGSHVSRKGECEHWDMPGVMDFSLWIRKTLGNSRVITHKFDAFDTPAMRNLFKSERVKLFDQLSEN